MSNLTLGSLFDGSGGFPLGGILAGITPLWASEIEPFPIRVTSKRLPNMQHLGDISKINGATIPPVDIITFGSPCQDMSIAGKRSGLSGSRSGLFYQAIRIIREMRKATNDKKPRYIVWENVPGAFSSNKGEDFRTVIETICNVMQNGISIPMPKKWKQSGEVLGNYYSIAWRVLDAQYWGVPQRRKRIFLVADFAGECAGKILFECESVLRDTSQSGGKGQGAATIAKGGARTAIETLNCQVAGFCAEGSANTRSIGFEEERAPTLRAGAIPNTVYENHSQDTRYTEIGNIAPTVSSTYGMGGNNQPFVVNLKNFDVRFTSENSKVVRHNVYETETCRTLDTSGNPPDRNQGGVTIISAEQSGKCGALRESSGMNALSAFSGKRCEGLETLVYSTSKNSYHTEAEENLANTLVASDYKGPPIVNYVSECRYIVRRLTPTECARLQGFPDWWCSNLGTDDPTEDEMAFWREVFESHRRITATSSKAKSDKQIKKWLKSPRSDSAEYKMWGNGVALPCVCFVLASIVYVTQHNGK